MKRAVLVAFMAILSRLTLIAQDIPPGPPPMPPLPPEIVATQNETAALAALANDYTPIQPPSREVLGGPITMGAIICHPAPAWSMKEAVFLFVAADGSLKLLHTPDSGARWFGLQVLYQAVAPYRVIDFSAGLVFDKLVVLCVAAKDAEGSAGTAVLIQIPQWLMGLPTNTVIIPPGTKTVRGTSVARTADGLLFGVGVDSNGSAADGASAMSFRVDGSSTEAIDLATVPISRATDNVIGHQVCVMPDGSTGYLYVDNHWDYNSGDIGLITAAPGASWGKTDLRILDGNAEPRGRNVNQAFLFKAPNGQYFTVFEQEYMDGSRKAAWKIGSSPADLVVQASKVTSFSDMVPASLASGRPRSLLAIQSGNEINAVWAAPNGNSYYCKIDMSTGQMLLSGLAWEGAWPCSLELTSTGLLRCCFITPNGDPIFSRWR